MIFEFLTSLNDRMVATPHALKTIIGVLIKARSGTARFHAAAIWGAIFSAISRLRQIARCERPARLRVKLR